VGWDAEVHGYGRGASLLFHLASWLGEAGKGEAGRDQRLAHRPSPVSFLPLFPSLLSQLLFFFLPPSLPLSLSLSLSLAPSLSLFLASFLPRLACERGRRASSAELKKTKIIRNVHALGWAGSSSLHQSSGSPMSPWTHHAACRQHSSKLSLFP
jgi:hypothetical protein